jgi:hypothetical protein
MNEAPDLKKQEVPLPAAFSEMRVSRHILALELELILHSRSLPK